MRIGREPAARFQLAPEVLELLLREPAFQEGPRVYSGRSVALKIDDVAFLIRVLGAEEVIEAYLIERRGRGIGRDVPADAAFLPVGAHHHGQGVPADQALDAALDFWAAGEGRLLLR